MRTQKDTRQTLSRRKLSGRVSTFLGIWTSQKPVSFLWVPTVEEKLTVRDRPVSGAALSQMKR